jgi:hypothetical protein
MPRRMVCETCLVWRTMLPTIPPSACALATSPHPPTRYKKTERTLRREGEDHMHTSCSRVCVTIPLTCATHLERKQIGMHLRCVSPSRGNRRAMRARARIANPYPDWGYGGKRGATERVSSCSRALVATLLPPDKDLNDGMRVDARRTTLADGQ